MTDRTEYFKTYRKEHKERTRMSEYNRLSLISDIKEKSGCVICGEKDPCCLEFHHLNPTEKEFGISELRSMEKTLKEIKKCIIVCRNCHAKIHAGKINVNDLLFVQTINVNDFVVQRKTQRAQTS